MIDLVKQQLTDDIKANQKIYDEFFDPQFAKQLVQHVLERINDSYFRSEFIGFEQLPERNNPDRPIIYAGNHSGMAFPWDAIIFTAELFRRNNFEFANSVRVLTAPMLSQTTLMNPFLVPNFWKRAGGIDATSFNFETMMYYKDSNLLIYPEGVPGIGKGFNRRYQLQRFSTSFIRISLKYRADIISFATVNGEYINPYSLNSDNLNKLANMIGIPFLPIGFITLLLPLQPWMFYFGFPAKLTYVMGNRIKPYEMVNKPLEEVTEEDIWRITEAVKAQMQEELNQAVEKYGKKPYQAKRFFAGCIKNPGKFPFFMPCFWPALFIEFNRHYLRKRELKKFKVGFFIGLKALMRNPFIISFFLPIIGWIPILLKGLRDMRKARLTNTGKVGKLP